MLALVAVAVAVLVAVLLRADEALEGGEVGQEGVVPGDEVGKGGQARVVGRGSGRVEGEEREVGVEGGDGVDELDEAEAERVEVGVGCCCWCWCAWCCLRVRAVAAVRVERRERRLHVDDWLGAGCASSWWFV